MSRYRKRQDIFDNVHEARAKITQWISSALGDSSIDWDDTGDDLSSLDLTVSDVTVAKYGHDGARHGFLVPDGIGGWITTQEDATAKADAAEIAAVVTANAYTDTKNTAMDVRMDIAEAYLDTAQSDIASLKSSRSAHDHRLDLIEAWLNANHPGWETT